MTQSHVLEVETERDFANPVMMVERTWEGPIYIVGSEGENILAVNSPTRVVLPFFLRDEDEEERISSLVEAARKERVSYKPEVHLVTVKLRDREAPSQFVAMFVAPEGASLELGTA